MVNLSYIGWINGLTAIGIVIAGGALGLFFIYRSKKLKAKLLLYLGLATIFAGLGQFGPTCDFLTILFTGKNIDNTYGLISILSFMFLPFAVLFSTYLGAELLLPEKKWYIIGIVVVVSIIFELIIFIDPMGSFTFIYPAKSGEDLIDDSVNFFSPAGIIILIYALSTLIFLGFGFLYLSIQTAGEARKNFLLLSIGMFLYIIFAALDGLTNPGIARIFVRIPQISGFIFMYFGLKK